MEVERERMQRDALSSLFIYLRSFICKGFDLLTGEQRKHTLALFFLMLEAISFLLDVVGKNRRTVIIAAFLLSAFGFGMTLFTFVVERTTVVTRLRAEKQLGVVEVLFSVVQLTVTYLDVVGVEVMNNYTASILLLVFAIISVVFEFKKDANLLDSSSLTKDYEADLISAIVDHFPVTPPYGPVNQQLDHDYELLFMEHGRTSDSSSLKQQLNDNSDTFSPESEALTEETRLKAQELEEWLPFRTLPYDLQQKVKNYLCQETREYRDVYNDNDDIPVQKRTRRFSFEELMEYTNGFSYVIGRGGYGEVYKGILPTGELIAVKRAGKESSQGAAEFENEIQILSRVHHKNVVQLLGFCLEQGEQALIYEYLPNGPLRDSLSGNSGIKLDWKTRLKITLDAARGLAYLHELVDPPIIHRDVKSTNILLDEKLNAKVADFGISKLINTEISFVSTEIKGSIGYLDPEYFRTGHLTEKSDVYGFGVVMLELLTARRAIEFEREHRHIVEAIKRAMDKEKYLYNLSGLLDPTIDLDATPKGFEKFVDVAMRCVEESGADRPKMNEVVKKIEEIFAARRSE